MKNLVFRCMVILSVSLSFYSCDKNGSYSRVSFDSSFPKRQKNLTYILGNQFTYVLDKDTITVKVFFDNNTKLNYLTNVVTGDTLFRGWVSKFRKLYYFTEQLGENDYWIYANQITDKEIKGLGSDWFQMEALRKAIDNGEYTKLIKIRDTSNHLIHLTYDKSILRKFYKSMMDSLPAMRILKIEKNKIIAPVDTITKITSKETLEQSVSIVKNVYPNPAIDNFNIDFEEEGIFNIDVFDNNGRIIHTSQVNSDKANIMLKGVKNGMYLVKTTLLETNETAWIKLMIVH